MRSDVFEEHFTSHQRVVEQSVKQLQEQAEVVARVLVEALREGHKVLAFGNGGSATQASHLVGELLGRFGMTRQPFPAIALASDAGTVTCITNDFSYDVLFERQVQALAQPGDVAVGFTTSGRSENVKRGLAAAQQRGAVAVAVTGAAGLVDGTADHVRAVPRGSRGHVRGVQGGGRGVWGIYMDES